MIAEQYESFLLLQTVVSLEELFTRPWHCPHRGTPVKDRVSVIPRKLLLKVAGIHAHSTVVTSYPRLNAHYSQDMYLEVSFNIKLNKSMTNIQ